MRRLNVALSWRAVRGGAGPWWRGGKLARIANKTLIVGELAGKKGPGYRETFGKKNTGGLSMAGNG